MSKIPGVSSVLITGGGGFLGTNLAAALIKEGVTVHTLARSDYPHLRKLGAKTFQGDIGNLEQLKNAAGGVDTIFHTAAKVAMWGRWRDFYQTNVVGTQNVITTCHQQGIKRLVYTSTPSVAFGNSSLCGVNESTPYPKKFVSRYAKSKAMAEQIVLAEAKGGKLATVSLRPHLILGPGDPNLVPRLVEAAKSGRLKIVGDGNNLVDVIHIDRAVSAHMLAMEKLSLDSPINGQAYFLGEKEPVKLWEFINQILAAHQLPPVTKKIPFKAAYAIGALMELGATMTGQFSRDLPMTRFVAMQFAHSHYFDHTKAVQELGFTPGPGISLPQGDRHL